ncbi:MAG: lysoplasmalogenase [Treponema sp.]|jgi:uncharacterized membrane protein YhhN|nr:lysoplasmalogenase [Treponema sp.]
MRTVFIALFIASAVVHLGSIFTGSHRVRKFTKACLLPLLLAAYMTSAKNFFAAVLLAILFDWGGDVLLLRSAEKKFFQLGLFCFLAGHLCYIFALIRFTGTFNGGALAASAAAAAALGVAALRFVSPRKDMRLPVIVYIAVIELMAIGSLQLLLYRGDLMGAAVFGGSLCFLFSDTVLGYFIFRTLLKYGDIVIMLPYILAQAGIVWGLAAI